MSHTDISLWRLKICRWLELWASILMRCTQQNKSPQTSEQQPWDLQKWFSLNYGRQPTKQDVQVILVRSAWKVEVGQKSELAGKKHQPEECIANWQECGIHTDSITIDTYEGTLCMTPAAWGSGVWAANTHLTFTGSFIFFSCKCVCFPPPQKKTPDLAGSFIFSSYKCVCACPPTYTSPYRFLYFTISKSHDCVWPCT